MDLKIINNIKSLGIDMINNANSGHPGIVLGAAPVIYTVFMHHLNINVNDPSWENRDRFVMSAGHGSALLYSTLFMAGYNISLDDLKGFRQIESKTPGHPEFGLTDGVESTTGPLGQGIANAVGMAIAGKLSHKKNNLFDYNVYVLCSDGDLMEGVANEALSLAGSLNLNNLIILYDSNDICLDGKVDVSFKENIQDKFKAMGFYTDFILDGNDFIAIDNAITKAKKSNMPSIIEIKTIIGEGSKYENTNLVHGKPLDNDDYLNIKNDLNYNYAFEVNYDARNYFIDNIKTRSIKKYTDFKEFYVHTKKESYDLKTLLLEITEEDEMRNINGKVMSFIGNNDHKFLSGSADLFSSTKTFIKDKEIFDGNNYGQNIAFGVREHAMAAVANGIALSGYKISVSTFLAFADYLKPALRLSCLMNLPVNYIFTHDSITIGSDGPTHQPIEQLAMLRSTPGLTLFRPSDLNELLGSWEYILDKKKTSALIVTKERTPKLSSTSVENTKKGAYIVSLEKERLNGIIIATGYELHLALKVKEELLKDKLDVRVVSMPSVDVFLKESEEYKTNILPKGYKTIVIEAASSYGWHRFVYNDNYLITLDNFGASGPKEDVLKHLNYDFDSVYNKIKKVLK